MSVVIPTYNRAGVVSRAIQSALGQTYQDLEVIVGDDASTDGTREVVEGIRDARVRYIRHDRNHGGGAARNAGIAAAVGEYVAFLDSDDEWLPDKLTRQLHAFAHSTPSMGAVCSGFVTVDGEGRSEGTTIPGPLDVDLDELLCKNRVGTASTVIARRECLAQVGGFDSSLASCQDWDLYIRLAKAYRFGFVPEVLVRYHVSDRGRITNDASAVVDGHLRVAEKYLEDCRVYTRPRRARHLYALGMRLVGLGHRFNAARALRRGRQLVLAAFLAHPLTIRYLAYYLASFNRFACMVVWRRVGELVQRRAHPVRSQARSVS